MLTGVRLSFNGLRGVGSRFSSWLTPRGMPLESDFLPDLPAERFSALRSPMLPCNTALGAQKKVVMVLPAYRVCLISTTYQLCIV